jgi:hypothetical protein
MAALFPPPLSSTQYGVYPVAVVFWWSNKISLPYLVLVEIHPRAFHPRNPVEVNVNVHVSGATKDIVCVCGRQYVFLTAPCVPGFLCKSRKYLTIYKRCCFKSHCRTATVTAVKPKSGSVVGIFFVVRAHPFGLVDSAPGPGNAVPIRNRPENHLDTDRLFLKRRVSFSND